MHENKHGLQKKISLSFVLCPITSAELMAPIIHGRTETPTATTTEDYDKRAPFTLGLEAASRTLIARSASTKTYTPGKGAINPDTIHNGGLMALFALLGAAFVLTAIWFFFWAKNGGFHWRKGDWEDYKSTVLRRKGPDGRTLSNATKSTKLGGGSILHPRYRSESGGMDSMSYTYTYTDGTGTTYLTEKPQGNKDGMKTNKKNDAKSVFTAGTNWKRKLQDKLHKQQRQRQPRDEEASCWEAGDDDHREPRRNNDDDDVLAYRTEKPARVGGMNRKADGTYHTSDYDSSYFSQGHAKDHHHRRDFSFARDSEETLTYDSPASSEKERFNHHRQNYSPSPHRTRDDERRRRERDDRERARESDRREREQRQRREAVIERQQRRHRRDRASPRKQHQRYTGHYSEPLDLSSYQYSSVGNDTSTKAYHHPIPGLSKGYRRDGGPKKHRRRDSLSDSD